MKKWSTLIDELKNNLITASDGKIVPNKLAIFLQEYLIVLI